MNKKDVGAALRRGVVAGTIAGSLAGWASFAAQAAVRAEFTAPESAPAVAPQLPALPAHPSLAPLPNVRTIQAPATVVLPPLRMTGAAPMTSTRTS